MFVESGETMIVPQRSGLRGVLLITTILAICDWGLNRAYGAASRSAQNASQLAPAAQSASAPSTQAVPPLTEAQQAELEAYLAHLEAPTVQAIVKSLEPIPTVDELLKPLPDDPNLPFRRALTGDERSRVRELVRHAAQLRNASELTKAIELAERAAAIRSRAQGSGHWQTIEAQMEAIRLRKEELLDRAHANELTTIDGIAAEMSRLSESGRSREALPLAERITYVFATALGEHIDTALAVFDLAMQHEGCSEYETAERLYRLAFAITRRITREDHPGVACCLDKLAIILRYKGDLADAEPLLRAALAMRRRLLGQDHPDVATSLGNLASVLRVKEDYARAELLYREALAMYRKRDVNEHPDVAKGLEGLAFVLRAKGDLEGAELLFREALTMHQKVWGNEHPHVAMVLNNLALVLHAKPDYAGAERLHREALGMIRRFRGNEHPDVAIILGNLGAVLRDRGDYKGAEQLFREALAMNQKLLGPEHVAAAGSLNEIASLLCEKGDLAGAEQLNRSALAIRRKQLGNEHRDVAASLNNLALVLRDKEDLAGAESLLREALAIRLQLLGSEHPDVAKGLANLANVLEARGNYAEAEQHLGQALTIYRKLPGPECPAVATILEGLAYVRRSKGDLEGAESLLREAIARHRRLEGNEHPVVATSLNNLAVLLYTNGDYAGAEPLVREAMAMHRKLLGKDHPDVAAGLRNLAALLYANGDYAGAEGLLVESAKVFSTARRRVSTAGLERVAFAQKHSPHEFLAACRARLSREADAWDALQGHLSRGLLDLLTEAHGRSLTPEEAIHEQELSHRLERLDTQIAALAGGGTRSSSAAQTLVAVREELDEAQAEWSRFREELTAKYGVTEGGVFDRRRIQRQVSADAAVVGWLDLTDLQRKGDQTGEHWGHVLRATGDPAFVKLPGRGSDGNWTAEDAVVLLRVRTLLSTPAAAGSDLQAAIEALRRQRLAPLEEHLAAHGDLPAVKHLVVIPAGWMNGIPIEALTDSYRVSYAHSPTVYAWLAEQRDPKRQQLAPSLLAVGDPPFSTEQWAQMRKDPEPRLAMARSGSAAELKLGQYRDAMAGDAGALDQLPRLLGTRREIRAIEQVFLSAARSRGGTGTQPAATVLLGAEACEQRLAHLGGLSEFRYLHFATHGFVHDERPERSCLILSRVELPDPLQAALDGKPVYDGRLTVRDIMNNWRLKADLVTLSACETGLGKQSGGEGFVGFAQALLFRGARSVVLSLWKVDDTATMLLMARFYENLLGTFQEPRRTPDMIYQAGQPMSKVHALGEAKVWLRSLPAGEIRKLLDIRRDEKWAEFLAAMVPRGVDVNRTVQTKATQPAPAEVADAVRLFEHPHYWAAFILVGDPD